MKKPDCRARVEGEPAPKKQVSALDQFLSYLAGANSTGTTKRADRVTERALKERLAAYFGLAKNAFELLVSEGLPSDELEMYLRAMGLVRTEEGKRALVDWKTDRQVLGLPNRVKAFAGEIQQVNEKSGLLYEMLVAVQVEARPKRPRRLGQQPNVGLGDPDPTVAWIHEGICRQMYDDFRRLPDLLRNFAKYLNFAVSQNKTGKRWNGFQEYVLRSLQERVKTATGHYHDSDLSDLLIAVLTAAGEGNTANKINDNQLKQFRARVPAPPIIPAFPNPKDTRH